MKLQCLKCGDIIEGDKKGTFITCSCKEIFIDETEWYFRFGGEPQNILVVEKNKTLTELSEDEND